LARSLQKQKPANPAKSENEGIQEIPRRTRDAGWPHPSLCGEVGRSQMNDHDERNQTGILTSGLNLAPAFPLVHAFMNNSVAVGSL